ncbi:MAG: FAD-dependent oxidoreductase [Nitrososphaerales archaeon]
MVKIKTGWMVKYIDTDVVIVGSGISGCTAAIECRKLGLNVVILEKGLFARSGSSRMGRRFIIWTSNIPRYSRWRGGSGAGMVAWWEDPELRKLCSKIIRGDSQEGWSYAAELESLGVFFRRYPDGTVWPEPTVGLHSMKTDQVGKMILQVLGPEVKRRGAIVLEETMATKVLTRNGRAVGVTALSIRDGNMLVISAKATIIATGGTTWYPTSSVPDGLSGDGLVMALMAGAELADICELVWYGVYKNPRVPPKGWRFSVAAWSAKPLDWTTAKFLNKYGEDILQKEEYKKLIEEAKAHGMDGKNLSIPIWLMTYIVASEIAAGRGTERGGVYVSYKHMSKETLELMKTTWSRYDYFKKIGLDPTNDLIEISFIPHTNCGGIVVDSNFETCVPCLFAIGGVITNPSIAMHLCIGQAKHAAKSVANRVKDLELLPPDEEQIKNEGDRIFSYIEGPMLEGAIPPAKVKKMIKNILQEKCYYWKNEKDMLEGLSMLEKLKHEIIPKMRLESNSRVYNQGLVEALETINLLTLSEIFIEMALMKKGSWGTFRRTDYPEESNFFTSIRVKIVNGEKKYRTINVPIPED